MRRRPVNRALVAVVLLPTIFGALALWTLSDRVEGLDAVPAAVVNLDQPVRTGKGEDRQTIAAGRLLAAGLTSPGDGEDQPLDWELTGADEAGAGLRAGDYHAVITIPRDFSRTVSGLTRDDPETARVTVRSNHAEGALVGVVSDQVAEVATARLNQQITAVFLEGMYARTGELKASLGEAERGAGRLADGTVRLGDGATTLSGGAGVLADGLSTLADGSRTLESGAGDLAEGATRLGAGGRRLEAGAERAAAGVDRLTAGLGELHARTAPLPTQTRRLADGAGELAKGVDGWSQVLSGWRQACESDPVLAGSHPRLCAATVQAVGRDGENAEAMVSGSRRIADGTGQLADRSTELVGALGRARDGAGRLAEGNQRLAHGTAKLADGAGRLAAGGRRLGDGARRISVAADDASTGAARLADGSSQIASGSARLSGGSRKLADGLGEGAGQIPDVAPAERSDLAAIVARPVVSEESLLRPASATTVLAPGVAALALWLGAFATYLARRALPAHALGATSAGRAVLAGWWPAAVLGLAQGGLLLAVLGMLGAELASPLTTTAFLLTTAAAFAAVNQALVAALGTVRGWVVSVVLVVLQAVPVVGLVPDGTPPTGLGLLAGALPVPLAADGLQALVLSADPGAALTAVAGLAVWTALGVVGSTAAARRRQRLSLGDLRRRVTTSQVT